MKKLISLSALMLVFGLGITSAQESEQITKLLQQKFTSVSFETFGYSDGLKGAYIVKSDTLYGVCDSSGDLIIPCNYKRIVLKKQNPNYYEVESGRKYGVYDLSGNNIVPCEYDRIYFSDVYFVYSNNKTGAYNAAGNFIIPCIYDDVRYSYSNRFYQVKDNGKYGACDEIGNLIIPVEYEDVWIIPNYFDYVNYYYSVKLNGKTGICDKHGNLIIPCKLDCGDLSLTKFWFDVNKFYYTNANGRDKSLSYKPAKSINTENDTVEKTLKAKYDKVTYYKLNDIECFYVKQKGKKGICKMDGVEVVPCLYDKVRAELFGYRVNIKDKQGAYDLSGEFIIQCKYPSIIPHGDYYEIMSGTKNNYKHGACDLSGNEIIPCNYDFLSLVTYCEPNYYELVQNGKKGICDLSGREIIPCQYERIYHTKDNYYEVTYYGNKGAIDLSGNVIVPCVYKEITFSDGEFLYMTEEGYYKAIDIENLWKISEKENLCLISGDNYYRNNDYGSAIDNYLKALEYNSRSAYAYYRLGCIYSNVNQNSEAINYFNKAIEIAPDYTAARNACNRIYSIQRGEIISQSLNAFGNAIINTAQAINASKNNNRPPSIALNTGNSTSVSSTQIAPEGKDYCNDPQYLALKKTDQRTYDEWTGKLMDMNIHRDKLYDDKRRKDIQATMKQIREKWTVRGCSFYKSDWEDWNGSKR